MIQVDSLLLRIHGRPRKNNQSFQNHDNMTFSLTVTIYLFALRLALKEL